MATLDTCDLQIVLSPQQLSRKLNTAAWLKKIWAGNVGLERVSYLAMETDIDTIWADQLEISTTPCAFDCRLWQRRGAFDDCLGGVWYLNRKCQAWSGPFFLVVRRRSVSLRTAANVSRNVPQRRWARRNVCHRRLEECKGKKNRFFRRMACSASTSKATSLHYAFLTEWYRCIKTR